MNVQTFLPGIRNHITVLFSRIRKSGEMQADSQQSPESLHDRDALFEEMLLNNPAAFASGFGMQWMYITYAKY